MNPGTVESPFLFDATDTQLERFFLLGAFVAGKHAGMQQIKLDQMLDNLQVQHPFGTSPLDMLQRCWVMDGCPRANLGGEVAELVAHNMYIPAHLKAVKAGQYTRLSWLFYRVAALYHDEQFDLRTITREQLIELPGYGLKTASFFLMFTRPGIEMSCLDVHILKYLREKGLAVDAPKSTPPPREYMRLEQVFLQHCRTLGRNPAELDFEIWCANSVTMKSRKFLSKM